MATILFNAGLLTIAFALLLLKENCWPRFLIIATGSGLVTAAALMSIAP